MDFGELFHNGGASDWSVLLKLFDIMTDTNLMTKNFEPNMTYSRVLTICSICVQIHICVAGVPPPLPNTCTVTYFEFCPDFVPDLVLLVTFGHVVPCKLKAVRISVQEYGHHSCISIHL